MTFALGGRLAGGSAIALASVLGANLLVIAPAAVAQTAPAASSTPQRFPQARRIEPLVASLHGGGTTNTIPSAPNAKQVIKAVTPSAVKKAAIIAPAIIAPQPKFVAYTCKIGQEYSVERKTCFTPGVTRVVPRIGRAASRSERSARIAEASAGRSALGRKKNR